MALNCLMVMWLSVGYTRVPMPAGPFLRDRAHLPPGLISVERQVTQVVPNRIDKDKVKFRLFW